MTKEYQIDAKLKFPSCNNSGYFFTVYAKDKRQAIKRARVEASYQGHTRMDGPLMYTATEIVDE